ncbi:ABC-type transport system involved in multi-copper enzyme maturation permease subunit [Streptosporangium becharense]|uniref:ABC-type transport system involved in multi-copper enzyme maturation permease subunit n=1 Tax=Streptosporangium becharense TaxID=1816182 RepID=A0A7W9MIZ2_9ACTN|nr:ABC transporter permease [Streptosporangium becharense]MBB2913118.1 ABC-type transport system involved in multi-copper enzyme maturation permease subunit [Streptosporangium becharense]MBB5822101.1 ABC-type transport system involved in multi-copper enzyme maturation permease subunit [Streptosporangium becharense]
MNLLASEWIKTRSVRSTWIIAAATVVVTVMVSLLGISGLMADWQAELPADFDPTGNSFKGILVGQILIATLGAQAITSEYATGQIITSLTIAPKRGALLATKLAVAALVALATAVVTVACSFGASQAALAAAGLPTASLADAGTIRAIFCAVAYLVLTAILGLAFGTITRSASGALAIIVTVALLVPALAPGMPGILGDIAGTYWPTTAGQTSYTITGTGLFPPLVGLAVMAVFTLWTALAAHLTLKTRDA